MLGRVVKFESVQTDKVCHEFMFNLTDEAWEDVKEGFKHNSKVVRETGVLLHVRAHLKIRPSPLRLP